MCVCVCGRGQFGGRVVQPRGVGGGGFESEIPFPEHSLLPVRLQQRLLLPRCKSKLSSWPSEVREARESFSRNSKQVSELQEPGLPARLPAQVPVLQLWLPLS